MRLLGTNELSWKLPVGNFAPLSTARGSFETDNFLSKLVRKHTCDDSCRCLPSSSTDRVQLIRACATVVLSRHAWTTLT